jgi:hypothetical protein
MKDFPVERNLMFVNNVGKHSVIFLTFSDMNKLTLDRDPMQVNNVEKPLVSPITSKHMKEFTLEAMWKSLQCFQVPKNT